jgi:chromosome partitioning protein
VGKVLAIANQKGGVGKTTTSVNLAASLKVTRKKVLLINFDQVVLQPEIPGYDLLPSNTDLVAAEIELLNVDDREFRLRGIIEGVRHNYDYIVIDCPPSLNMLTVNAVVAADGVVIPMQCEYYALEGLSALMETIATIRDRFNPQLKIEGILRTMYDPRNKLTTEVSGQLFSYFGDTVYRTVVPRNVRLAEAPSYGVPVIKYDRQSRGALAYLALAGELLRRNDEAAAGVAG